MKSNDDNVQSLFSALADALGEVAKKISAKAKVNRGVCAGSVEYTAKPTADANELDVMGLVLTAYKFHDLEIDLDTPDGAKLFFKVFLEGVKQLVSANRTVTIVDRLKFLPRIRKDSPDSAYMLPVGCSAEFNRLPSEVDLAQSPSFITRKKREAKKKPYDKPTQQAAVGRVTHIKCPKCGTKIVIENTEK